MFLEATRRTLEELAELPQMGSPQTFSNPRLEGIRKWRVRGFEKYLIFYYPLPDGIEVVRVIHAARDIAALFEDPESD